VKRALLQLLLLAGGLAPLASAWAQDRLATEMMKRVKQRYPDLEVRLEDADRIELLEAGKGIATLDLGNLREICRKNADACEEQKARRIDLVAQLRGGKSGFQLAKVRAVLRPTTYAEGIRQQFDDMKRGKSADEIAKIEESLPLQRPFGSAFVRMWVQDFPTGMSPVSADELKRAKLGVEDLDRASAANMLQEEVPALEQTKAHPALWVSAGNDYVGSVFLDEALWRRVAGARARDEVAACLPERHTLIAYFPRLDPRREVDIVQLCRRAATDGAPSFSGHVLRRINDNWQIR
jgi:hypothetical protein